MTPKPSEGRAAELSETRIKGTPAHFHYYFRGVYRSIRYRCLKGPKRYIGKPFMSEEQWEQFLIDTTTKRMNLYHDWQEGNFIRRLAPSIDRIDVAEGYLPSNCRWIPQYENSIGGGKGTANSTHCKNGHLWVAQNIYSEPNPTGQEVKRKCRTCTQIRESVRNQVRTELKGVREIALKQAAAIVRTHLFEALGQEEKAEEWLANKIESLTCK